MGVIVSRPTWLQQCGCVGHRGLRPKGSVNHMEIDTEWCK